MGDVRSTPGARIWGVAYELPTSEAQRLDGTEGGGRGAYTRVGVTVEARDGRVIQSFTYHSARGAQGRKPSRRYLGLLLAGARHHGLPPDYIEELRAIPLAVDERDTQLELPL